MSESGTPRSGAGPSLYDELDRKPKSAPGATRAPFAAALTHAGGAAESSCAPADAPAGAAPAENAGPQPQGLRDRLSAAAEKLAPPRGCTPRAPFAAGGGTGPAKYAHLYEEAQAVREVMTESARAAAEAMSTAAAKTAAGVRRAAELGVEVGEAAVKGFWDRVLPDPEWEEKMEEAAREAAARGYTGVRRARAAAVALCIAARSAHAPPRAPGCGAVEGAWQPDV